MGDIYDDQQLIALDDAAFNAEATRRIEALRRAVAVEEAESFYRGQVLPCEAERLKRDAKRRAHKGEARLELLFVTVGAQADSPALAVIASPAEFVVLVHSNKERRQAEQVVERLGLTANRGTLCSIGDGTRISDLYRVCFDEWQRRGRPERVAFDLTGGLKTMSAAAAAAGFAIPGAAVHYIEAEQPRIHGKTFWINERRITLDNPFIVFGEIRRESARALLASRAYPAAAVFYEEIAGQTGQAADDCRAQLAKGYAAFDALRFEEAANILTGLADDLDARERDTPDLRTDALVAGRARIHANADGARILADFVKSIDAGQDPVREKASLEADACRDFICMLIESTARQRKAHQHDVAALLAYRASEAVVHRRLVLRGGVDPGSVDWQALATNANLSVDDLITRYNKGTAAHHRLDAGSLPVRVGRVQAFGLLAVAFPNDVAAENDILKFAGLGEARNRSLLAHGLARLSPDTVGRLIKDSESLFSRMLKIEAVAPADQEALWQRYRFLDVAGDWADRTG